MNRVFKGLLVAWSALVCSAVFATSNWPAYQHTSGVSFRYPPSWQVQQSNGYLQIIPPDLATGDEIIYILGSYLAQPKPPGDPSVIEYLDNLMRQEDAYAKRIAGPEAFSTSVGEGARYEYNTTNANTGAPTRSRIYVIMQNNMVVSFFVVGSDERVEQRARTVDKIVASFGNKTATPPTDKSQDYDYQAGEQTADDLDPALLGYWYGETISTPVEGIMVNSRFTYLFLNNGQVFMGAKGAVNAASQGQSGVYNGGAYSGENSDVNQGRWRVQNGVLLVQWKNGGQTQRHYRVRGNTLEIRNAQGKLITFYER